MGGYTTHVSPFLENGAEMDNNAYTLPSTGM